MEKDFQEFLAKEGIQDRFLGQIRKPFAEIIAGKPEDYVIGSFFWTADDYPFWCTVHNKWIAILNCRGYESFDYL
jgi:hypothetical protein